MKQELRTKHPKKCARKFLKSVQEIRATQMERLKVAGFSQKLK